MTKNWVVALKRPDGGLEKVEWYRSEAVAMVNFERQLKERQYPDDRGRDLFLFCVIGQASTIKPKRRAV